MKSFLGKLFWLAVFILVMAGLVAAFFPSHPDAAARRAVAATRQSLRDQGFKTDLADFDFSTFPELRAREPILLAATTSPSVNSFQDYPDLMTPVGTDSAIVFWKQDAPQTRSGEDLWPLLHEALDGDRQPLDAACAVIMSGPIVFNLDARRGSSMLLPHLATVKKLGQMFGSRAVLDLHDGNRDAAWTNLMAASRLVKAWQVEPTEISHLVRFADLGLAFAATWQALQTNGWPDDKLARLQTEWEAVNFFTNLPETIAFQRACAVANCEFERQRSIRDDYTFIEFCKEVIRFPPAIFSELTRNWNQRAYRQHGSYEDEKGLLLFYRDREVEVRNAIQAATWAQMRQLPGVTNETFIRSRYSSRMQALMNLRRIGMARQNQGSGFLGRAAEAEARRRILITALALERYRGKFGLYPATLAALQPEFMKSEPLDFMDGQPLRYRLTKDGYFSLYSVGLDCVDNGGKTLRREERLTALRESRSTGIAPEADIVWPLPATSAAVQDLRRQEARTEELQNFREQQQESEAEWKQSPLRRSRVVQILATNWWPILDDGFFGDRPATEFLRNAASASNRLSLAELMTPRQVLTGNESEDLTFEFPVSYDAITNHGFFLLLDADMDPGSMFAPDSGAKVQERSRAPNGDCLLVWHTIYDPPGQHALQAELTWYNANGAETWCRGPAISVVTSNLCQFSLDSSTYDIELGATFHARLPEANGLYTIECVSTNGEHLKTITGSTTNGEFKTVWNLVDDHGHRLHGETFNSMVHITLPDSGRSQTLKGP